MVNESHHFVRPGNLTTSSISLPNATMHHRHSELINVNVFPMITVPVFVEFKANSLLTLVTICVRLVDFGSLGQFSVSFQRSGPVPVVSRSWGREADRVLLICRVFQEDVAFLVLIISER